MLHLFTLTLLLCSYLLTHLIHRKHLSLEDAHHRTGHALYFLLSHSSKSEIWQVKGGCSITEKNAAWEGSMTKFIMVELLLSFLSNGIFPALSPCCWYFFAYDLELHCTEPELPFAI